LRAVQLAKGGILRVYAGCCRTPVANVPSPKLAFVGIPHLFLRGGAGGPARDALLGPLSLRLQGRFCRGVRWRTCARCRVLLSRSAAADASRLASLRTVRPSRRGGDGGKLRQSL